MNETLCRALLQARLTEEDVAARLQVDPKTVRRWLEGRLPYLRHRWALAAMLGACEADLWPQLRAVRQRPEEIKAIYAHRDAVPRDEWLGLFRSAHREIDVLDRIGLFLAGPPAILATLADRVQAGVRVRICLSEPDCPGPDEADSGHTSTRTTASSVRDAFAHCGALRASGRLEIRLHRGRMYNVIYRGDDQLLVGHHAHGIPDRQAPVLHLDGTAGREMVTTYLEEFDRIWASGGSLD